ncbi:small conductance mechanosensitive channel [Asanoa ferruginea]|uniref:Small conductance mechanosensitive channel n=1 Tax=Asanoa ferruginea TaxID=53367 RepID=A0A3D9ZAS6_9ACTN|nr:small conductance mechanosensitive channel [Asanoa ferruginea]
MGSYYFLVKPLRIIAILLLAVVARYLLHKLISRLVRTGSEGSVPTILKPLRNRKPSAASVDPAVVVPERRRQRAEAIGSVLRSLVTAFVFSIALLMVLEELSFNLAPLLASAGILGLAVGFGAQSLVKDLLGGLFMLLEDQYGVGDNVDLGEATGVVESVGLRITTVRDARGVLWYIRNGEIIRVGNKSQGWAMLMIDMPIGFADAEAAVDVLRTAAAAVYADPELTDNFVEPPEVLGVESVTVDGTVIRTVAKTTSDGQYVVGRELRRRLTEALASAGVTAQLAAARVFPRPATPEGESSGVS